MPLTPSDPALTPSGRFTDTERPQHHQEGTPPRFLRKCGF